MLVIFQEEKLKDDSLPVTVPADPGECRLFKVRGSYTITVAQLRLLISAR